MYFTTIISTFFIAGAIAGPVAPKKLDHYYPGSIEFDHPSQPAVYTMNGFKGIPTQLGKKNECYNSGGQLMGSITSVFVPKHFACKTYVLPNCETDNFQDWVGTTGNVRVERLVGSYIGSIQCRALF